MNDLSRYHQKRDFDRTPEPSGGVAGSTGALRYGVQMHAATRLHWDLRLEWNGVLLSWAVTRGPSTDPRDKRLAVRTEDHPFDYLTFEGVIPEGNYGAGTVMLWDIGWWEPFHDVGKGLDEGHLHFALHGQRATGGWSLVRMKSDKKGGRENWLMLKERDEAATEAGPVPFAEAHGTSVTTGRDLDEIALGAPAKPALRPRKAAAPRFRPVQLAQTVDAPPEGPGWLHEVKLDGYRAQVAIGRGGPRIRTRNGHDWTDRFAALVPALDALPCDSALIDAEIVAGAGLAGFSALQDAIKAGGPFLLYAFDLLCLDGRDLADRPLSERRAALDDLLAPVMPRGVIRGSPGIDGAADEALRTVCDAGGEGIVSKRDAAPYRGGRSAAWVKTKCIRRAEFVICGWHPSTRRGRAFASLLLATMDDGTLVYRGAVGTGFGADRMDTLAAALAPLRRETTPLARQPAEARGAVWVEPRLIAEIDYAEVTAQGRLRHARFVALREDKLPAQVAMDRPRAGKGGRVEVAGINVSHPERVIFETGGVTKLDLARYVEAVADRMLPTLADRPCALLRLPEGLGGEQFFQKHAGAGFPEAIRRVTVSRPDGGQDACLAVTDVAGLVAAVQMGAVEFHPWATDLRRPDRPERLIFDLDPDEGLSFASVREAAVDVRDRLADLGLHSWAMLSGGKGVHVVVPLRRTASWQTAKLFAELLARLCVAAHPDRYVATMSKAARKGKIFIDWLRNERGATAIAPFSVRARPGAPVAVPVAWDELQRTDRADAFDIHAARERTWEDIPRKPAGALNAVVLKRLEGLSPHD